jgi:hypothetical protein
MFCWKHTSRSCPLRGSLPLVLNDQFLIFAYNHYVSQTLRCILLVRTISEGSATQETQHQLHPLFSYVSTKLSASSPFAICQALSRASRLRSRCARVESYGHSWWSYVRDHGWCEWHWPRRCKEIRQVSRATFDQASLLDSLSAIVSTFVWLI